MTVAYVMLPMSETVVPSTVAVSRISPDTPALFGARRSTSTNALVWGLSWMLDEPFTEHDTSGCPLGGGHDADTVTVSV